MEHLQCKKVVSFTLTFFSKIVILPEIFSFIVTSPYTPQSQRPWSQIRENGGKQMGKEVNTKVHLICIKIGGKIILGADFEMKT